MNRFTILLIDGCISLVLGLLLVVFPERLVELLGIPPAEPAFYPRMLGAVVMGIAVALFWECRRGSGGRVGLGVAGAIAIDLCAAALLAGWLLLGGLNLALRGRVVLWVLVAVLVLVSGIGLAASRKPRAG